ncbi:hypothetical protein STEG23_003698 [Scotinomys teguina]
MPLDQKDPGHHWTRKIQEHLDTIGPEGPRCNQMIWFKRTQKHPRRHRTRRSQKQPEAFSTKRNQKHPNSTRQRGLKRTQTPLDQETYAFPII